jgi:thiamine-monophosphate kinase
MDRTGKDKAQGPAELVSDVGEFGLIARIADTLSGHGTASVALGLGDDAAVVAAPDGRVVISTDMLVEGRHFRRDWSSPSDVGRKAAAQNLIDVCVMGATPTTLVVALAIPADLPVEWVTGFYQGMRMEAEGIGASIVGGDVVRNDRIVISVTVLGDLAGGTPVLRSTAGVGDTVAVCGRLGWAAAGLSILSRGFRSPASLVDAHRRPEPPYAAALAAARGGATAMLDVSDGLISDLGHLARASGVAIDVDPNSLRVDDPVRAAAAAFNANPLKWLLTGGDDHAVVATFPEGVALPEGFYEIAMVLDVADGAPLTAPGVTVGGRVPLGGGGHDHFAS